VTATVASSGVERAPGAAERRRPARSRRLWSLAACVLVVAAAVGSVWFGSRGVSWSDVWGALGGADETLGEAAVTKRIPRTLLALVVGAALGVSGAVMQGVTRNPLADPGVLGINMGASLAVVIGIAYFGLVEPRNYIWVAIGGAALAAAFVYLVGSIGRGGATPLKLALAGAATSAAATSFVIAIVLPRNDISETVQAWQVGGVGGGTFDKLRMVAPFLAAGFAICALSARGLNSIALGDEVAAGLGENVALTRALAGIGSVVLCGASTAVCGPIGFVGLVVPHACRLVVGPDYRWVVPLSALTGATLVTVSDTIGRVIAKPEEIDVGIVTAIVGAPVFIYIVRRQRVREL
jgi:iron complex transport system permease protein